MDFIEYFFLGLAYFAVIGFLISGLDDLFFDSHFLLYLFREIFFVHSRNLKLFCPPGKTLILANKPRPIHFVAN